MRIITWNVNRFDGIWEWYSQNKDLPIDRRREFAITIINKLKVLLTAPDDIAILQEVPYRDFEWETEWETEWKNLFDGLSVMFWLEVAPGRNDFNFNGSKNVIVAVTKKDGNWNIRDFDNRVISFDKTGEYWDYTNRYIELVNGNMSILGFHLSLGNNGSKQWEKIQKSAERSEFTFIVGDFNVNDLLYPSNKELSSLETNYKRTINNDIITQNQAITSLDNIFVKKDFCENIYVSVHDYCFISELDGEKSRNIRYSDHNACICELLRRKTVMAIEKALAQALTKMFPNGGETYTRDDVRRIFEEEGVDVSDFDSVLNRCIKDGWIIDCGDNNYTR